jgi:hypothetical protein
VVIWELSGTGAERQRRDLAAGKARTGRALGNHVLRGEGRVTMIDGILATAVLAAKVLVLSSPRSRGCRRPVAG